MSNSIHHDRTFRYFRTSAALVYACTRLLYRWGTFQTFTTSSTTGVSGGGNAPERPRTAGRIAPTGRVTPSVHQSAGGGRRKAIPVPPPRVPTPMPSANNNQQRNNANFDVGPPVVVPPPPPPSAQSQKKESHENIARIAKRYLDDNMQQAWINPRLISMEQRGMILKIFSRLKASGVTGFLRRPSAHLGTYVLVTPPTCCTCASEQASEAAVP
ncbi:hypothetical protein M0802_006359 [Mischocyttarus mexicanus]|nr:hypothetical protein M0802_006359 [Mischocyttarus mexicanus]